MMFVDAAIDAQGALSANYVFNIIISVVGVLGLIILNDIRVSLKKLETKTESHSISIAEHSVEIKAFKEKVPLIDEGNRTMHLINDNTNQILAKLSLLKQL